MLSLSTCQNFTIGSDHDDVMEPLFHSDWLQEHNLDTLFDLFEECSESKDSDIDSSTAFEVPPFASYLFGASPTLNSSILDLSELLYLEQPSNSSKQTTTSDSIRHNDNNGSRNSGSQVASHSAESYNKQVTNPVRINRRSKKVHSKGVSLLAKPSKKSRQSCQHHHSSRDRYRAACAIIIEHAYAARTC